MSTVDAAVLEPEFVVHFGVAKRWQKSDESCITTSMLTKLVWDFVCVHERRVSKSQRRDVELLVDATWHILHAIDFDISASFMIKSVTFALTNHAATSETKE